MSTWRDYHSSPRRPARKKDAPISDCILWPLGRNSEGYGVASFKGTKALAHRVAYETAVGPIPEGLELDHLCRVPACINPNHLEPVTHRENLRRGANRYREQTHCKAGHAFDDANTYFYAKGGRSGGGRRDCRACMRERRRKYLAKVAS